MTPPKHDPDVWLFDVDNTLYPARSNLFAQIDVRIGRYISDWLKVDAEEARHSALDGQRRLAGRFLGHPPCDLGGGLPARLDDTGV